MKNTEKSKDKKEALAFPCLFHVTSKIKPLTNKEWLANLKTPRNNDHFLDFENRTVDILLKPRGR